MKKTVNKILCVLLSAVMLFTFLPAFSALAEEAPGIVASGYCGGEGDGTNLTWTLDTEGTLTISGSGPMAEENSNVKYPWASYVHDVKKLVLEERMTSIGGYSCIGFKITELIIPSGLTQIGSSAFYFCSELERVVLPENLPKIAYGLFRDCKKLTDINIPASVQKIEPWAFRNCSALSQITIPDAVTEIGYEAFMNCVSLSEITLPEHLTSIGYYAFEGCSALTSINIPDSVTSIGEWAFAGCGISTVTVPGSVESIGVCPFVSCISLKSAVIAPGVTSIPSLMFCGSTEIIVIPKSVTKIGSPIVDTYMMGSATLDIYYEGSKADWHLIEFEQPVGEGPYFGPLEEYAVMHYNYQFQTVDETASTCTKHGYTEGLFCDVTGTWVSGHKELPLAQHTPGVTARENETAATCTADGGYDEVVYCTQCPAELSRTHVTLNALGHAWGEWKAVKEATVEEAGLKRRTCANDASHVEELPIPKLDPPAPEDPGTGSGAGTVAQFLARIRETFRGIIDWFLRLFGGRP